MSAMIRPADYAFCVAPMLDWTDRHCRHFHRLLSRRARLYTEMVTTGALRHGDVARHLAHEGDAPVALQVGGCEPDDLALAARLAEQWGYDEVNLNCGCPSERVQRGAFGACLMAEPRTVAEGVAAMRAATRLPVTVKHRIGLGRNDDYGFVRDFVGIVGEAGCEVFIVHARNAWLEGLSPKENREVPPLRHDVVHRLARDFPRWRFVINGGLHTHPQALAAGAGLAGVMVGRQAYQEPWMLADVDRLYGSAAQDVAMPGLGTPPAAAPDRAEVVSQLADYAARQAARGTPLRAIVRHVLGLCNGLPGARAWRRTLSDPQRLRDNDARLIEQAWRMVRAAVPPEPAAPGLVSDASRAATAPCPG